MYDGLHDRRKIATVHKTPITWPKSFPNLEEGYLLAIGDEVNMTITFVVQFQKKTDPYD